MKTIGFITSPLNSGHAVRGVGFYTKNLLEGLKTYASEYDLQIQEVSDASLLHNHTFDLVHYPFFDLFSPSLPIFKSTKTVVTIHDVIPLEFPDIYRPGMHGRIKLLCQKLALGSTDRVITDSQASVVSINKLLHVPHEKLKLIYLAASSAFKPIQSKTTLSALRKKYHLPEKFVLYVGDVNWNKNIPGLLKACRLAKLPLVWVGKQATELEKLDSRHPELAHVADVLPLLDENVYRLGFVSTEDLAGIYNLAQVYCQPSFAEGFGLPVLEALACGTAVACSNSHSLPEIAGECAVYFDPHNVNEMAAAIASAKHIDSSVQLHKFTWEKVARETLQVYNELL